MKLEKLNHNFALSECNFTIKSLLFFAFFIFVLNSNSAQQSLQVRADFGINLPRSLNNNTSNSPYKSAYNGALEIAYHWKWVGLGIQVAFFQIENQNFDLNFDFNGRKEIWSLTNFESQGSNFQALHIPVYFHVYNKKRLRISPFVGFGLANFHKSGFTLNIESVINIDESEIQREKIRMYALKTGLNIRQSFKKRFAINYNIQRNFATEFFGEDILIYDLSVGVSYSILNKVK